MSRSRTRRSFCLLAWWSATMPLFTETTRTVAQSLRLNQQQSSPPRSLQTNNVLSNGGFEGSSTSTDWSGYREGYVISTIEKRSGSQSARVNGDGAARQVVPLGASTAPTGSTVTISGYSKSVGVSQDLGYGDYSLYADVKYESGNWLYGQIAPFSPGTHDWEYGEVSFVLTEVPIKINVYAMYRDDSDSGGTAYFDDLEVTVVPLLVINGGFEGEAVTSDWTDYGNGFVVSTTEQRSGSQCVAVTDGAAKQLVTLNAAAGSTVVISGYSKASGVSPDVGAYDYSIYADVKYQLGGWLYGQVAPFGGGTHDWEYSERSFVLPEASTSMYLYAMYRNDAASGGTAYFDDVSVSVQEPPSPMTENPTLQLTEQPTENPTLKPTEKPTEEPTLTPTIHPTQSPTEGPTPNPSPEPTESPTSYPTEKPTENPTTGRPVSQLSPGLKVMVPVYFYPDTIGMCVDESTCMCTDAEYVTLADGGELVASIINPNNGPVPPDSSDTNYFVHKACTDMLGEAGNEVFGYVKTKVAAESPPGSGIWVQQGFRSLSDINSDLEMYRDHYNVNGIFLDEVSNIWQVTENQEWGDHVAFYQAVFSDVSSVDASWKIVINPGSPFPTEFFTTEPTADVAIIFEGAASGWDPEPEATCLESLWTQANGEFGPGPWCRYVPEWDGIDTLADGIESGAYVGKQASALIYAAGDTSASVDEVVNLAYTHNLDYIYVTDLPISSPWASLPTDWDGLLQAVVNANIQGSPPTSAPIEGALFPTLAPTTLDSIPPETVTTLYYAPSSADYPHLNPERGFYRQETYRSLTPLRLTASDTEALRNDGYTIMLRLYYLDKFMFSPLETSFLDDLVADFDVMRQGGVKAVLRFAYSDSQSDDPRDPTKEIVLNHISLLAPFLSDAEDVIMAVQAGFIGAWGEWYYSTHFGNPDLNEARDWDASTEVLNALVDAVPSSRTVQLRTPLQKRTCTGTNDPLTNLTAHDGTFRARIGHHNDCFLASNTDYGTYTNIAFDYAYLELDAKYTSMGGETCAVNPPRSECAVALDELQRFSWTYLNAGYQGEVLASWEAGGCMEQVSSKLGYRLVLKQGTYSVSHDGGLLSYKIEFENEGYAAPINSRPVQLVLRHFETGELCTSTDYTTDTRTWYGGESHILAGAASIPIDIPAGTYELLLNLADPSPSLHTKVEFKVKVANDLINEEGTGFIKLRHLVTINGPDQSSPTNEERIFSCSATNVLPDVSTGSTGTMYLSNGGFEGSAADVWSAYGNGFVESRTESFSGTQSVAVEDGAAKQTVVLNAAAGSNVTLSGYSKAIGISPGPLGSDYSIYADVTYADGGNLWGRTAKFSRGSHDWEFSAFSFVLPQAASKMSVFAMYRNDAASGGIAYFDDVEVLVDGEVLVTCPTGYYAQDSDCVWCPAGFACDPDTGRAACSVGTYAAGGASACTPCEGCNGRGVCSTINGLCICNEGWTGPFCDEEV